MDQAAFEAANAVSSLVSFALSVLTLAGMWKLFEKAGRPGWAAIIPIYNAYVLLKVVGRPGWWLVLYLIPIVNLVIAIIVTIDVARAFGKDVVYAIGLLLLPFVFYPLLGFGPDRYVGPAH